MTRQVSESPSLPGPPGRDPDALSRHARGLTTALSRAFSEYGQTINQLVLRFRSGPLAERPDPSADGRYFYATDVSTLYRDTGSVWEPIAQDVGSVAFTGGTMDGVEIGGSDPAPGTFTALTVIGPVTGISASDVGAAEAGHTHQLNDILDSGSMAGQDAGSVDITGGSIKNPDIDGGTIDDTPIGETTPAPGFFTNLSVSGDAVGISASDIAVGQSGTLLDAVRAVIEVDDADEPYVDDGGDFYAYR